MRRFLPSLPALQAFEAAARHSSFTKAAEELGITQSGVSRNIATLEQFMGLRLFERAGSRLVLTDIGNTYYQDVLQILSRLEEVSIDAIRGRKASSSLIVGCTPTMASAWLVPRLPLFFAAHPDIPVEVVALGDHDDIDTIEVDVAIIRGAGQLHARALPLFDETLVVVAGRGRMERAPEVLDFEKTRTLQNASRPSLWLTWLRISGMAHQGPIQGTRFAQSAMLISGALNGLGLAVVPTHYVERERAEGSLVTPFGPGVASGESYWLVMPERKHRHQRVRAFRDWITAQTRAGQPKAPRPPA